MSAYETEPYSRPQLGEEGEPCADCGARLASDQRYCLNCGSRRAGVEVPRIAAGPEPASVAVVAPPPVAEAPIALPWYRSAMGGIVAVAGVALLGTGLALGLLLHDDPKPTPAPVQKPPVVNITNTGGGGGGAAAAATPVAFTSDWPEGQSGWTVQLQALPKASTQPDAVAAAKSAATGQGAQDVGALDSDAFPGLDPGQYVVYSGRYASRKAAAKAAKRLKRDFPGATAIQVGGAAAEEAAPAKKESKADLKKKESLTPEQYQQEQKKKQPTKVQSEGKAPPKDNKAPGGGSGGGTEIG
jgi:hypothetical protein